jgi:hypothetical protein
MLRAPHPGHSLQKRTVVQWDMGAVLGRDGCTDESMSPQFGISFKLESPIAPINFHGNPHFVVVRGLNGTWWTQSARSA